MSTKFERLLEQENILLENFSTSSYMDVRELRALYYGRIDIMVSFSNEADLNDDYGRTFPRGYICYTLEDVVGRRVSSDKFYAHVLRLSNNANGIISDIRNYSRHRYNDDLEILKGLPYINTGLELDEFIRKVDINPRISSSFHKIWMIMDRVFDGFEDKSERWNQAFLDLGIRGIVDQRGYLLGKRSTMLFDKDLVEMIDIVPVQMYREDPRNRVRAEVDRLVDRLKVRRNRIAKKPLKDSRGDSKTLQKNLFQKLI